MVIKMKEKMLKLYNKCLKLIPVCATLMLAASANSSMCWIKGQDDVPASLKSYRKF